MLLAPVCLLAGLGLTLAADVSPRLPPRHLTKEQLGARMVAELAERTDRPPAKLARQLLGGGDDYAPYEVPCPSDQTWIRSANGLSAGEQQFLQQRQQYLSAINTMMAARGLPEPPRTPVIGLALSGGGYRAMTNGLGGIMATMNQSSEAAESGVGGWLDGLSYLTGLSGGSWATGTFIANGGQLPTDLVQNVLNMDSNLIAPSDGKVAFYYNLLSEVNAKSSQGFPTQITDYWGLALGNHLLPEQYHLGNSPNYTFSSLPSTVAGLGNASLPMPIIVAAEREAGELVVAENATVWEFTPYEFGAWAFGANTKVRGAFTPLEYLGTPVDNGQSNGTCWKGFDQFSFITGTSATLFSGGLLQLNGTDLDGVAKEAVDSILGTISQDENDIARVPNTFYNWNSSNNPISDLEYITLVDAGLTNQNIPIEPLLIPSRKVDAIIALDSSADTTYSWPNGSALRTTYERAVQLAKQQDVGIRMPEVPSESGFINGGLNTRPVFFGCNDTTTPVIIYVPNYPWSYASNVSTYQLEYDMATANGVVLNGMRTLTLNGSVPTWPTCLACALTDRAFDYDRNNRTSECQSCFDTWCWNGQDDSSEPSGDYAPVVGSTPSFITDRNLSDGSAPSGTNSEATSSTPTGAAGKRMSEMDGGWKGLGMGLLCMMVGGALIAV